MIPIPVARVRALAAVALLLASSGGVAAEPAPAARIGLSEAIGRALAAAPSLRAGDAGIAAARAGRIQAAVRPTATIDVEGENLAGTGDYSVLEQPEITASYEQPLERSSKREARVALADREVAVAEAARDVRRLELAGEVARAYVSAQTASARLEVARSRLDTERQLQAEALRRVRAAKDPLFVGTRAAARVAEANLSVDQAERTRSAALDRLTAFWGGGAAEVDLAGFRAPAPVTSGDVAAAEALLAEAEVARAAAAIQVERTRLRSDVTVRGGARYLRGTDDVALVAGVSIPLARASANRGNIERAAAERLRAELDAEASRLARRREIARLAADAEGARRQALAIGRDVVPMAERALAQVREGYARGGFSYLDIQESSRALAEAREAQVAALARHHEARVELDRLTGRLLAAAPMETDR